MNELGLAVEATKIFTKSDGIVVKRKKTAGVEITDVVLDSALAKRAGKPAGRYITLGCEEILPQTAIFAQRALKELVKSEKRILVAGLGNPDITHDSLGAACVRKIFPKAEKSRFLAAMETDVAARTGIGTARLVRAAAREIGADCVVAIDALACRDPRRIGKTVQLSDTGFVLGSGAGENRGEISRKFLGISVIAIGVPTLARPERLLKNTAGNFLVTTFDIDTVVGRWAEVISEAVNGM